MQPIILFHDLLPAVPIFTKKAWLVLDLAVSFCHLWEVSLVPSHLLVRYNWPCELLNTDGKAGAKEGAWELRPEHHPTVF